MTKLILALLFPFLFQSGGPDCRDLKEGVFKLESSDGSLHTIVRTKNKQTETVAQTGLVSEFDIRWTSDCSYLLYNRRVLKGNDDMPEGPVIDTLYNEIVEIDAKTHKVVSSIKGYELKVEARLVKI